MNIINTFFGKKKTLVTILNHNLPEISDSLYSELKKYAKDYDIALIDNGSENIGQSKNTTHRLPKNIYFGGGLNYAFELVIKNPQYDSLLFLNNDLIIHGPKFVNTLRKWMFESNFKILSPCILQPEKQLVWKTMHNWGSNTPREVSWIDFQAPLIHRDVIEKIIQYPKSLKKGYGYDIYTAMVCENNNWKIGICDMVPVIHHHGLTFNNKIKQIDKENYRKTEIENMEEFFTSINEIKRYHKYRKQAKNYSYN